MASSKRERELARMRAERQAARRAAAEAHRRRRRNGLLSALAALAVIAVVAVVALTTHGTGKKVDTLATAPTASASAAPPAAAGPCQYKSSGNAAKPVTGRPPATGVGSRQTVSVTTSRGPLTLTLDGKKAPCTVGSFTFLAGQKYFDGTSCHRLTTAGIFVLQCGDPTGSGSGGPGYEFKDENLTGATYPRGTVAMANAGPGTNGSQFFLVYKDTQLPASYTPFGTITKGLDVVDKVAAGGSEPSGDGKPKLRVSLEKVTATSG